MTTLKKIDTFSNGLYTVTHLEYGINDYAIVDGVGRCSIVFDLDNPSLTYVIINDVRYLINEFMRVSEG